MADEDRAMTIYLRLLTEQAEQALAAHEASIDGLDRAVRDAAALRDAAAADAAPPQVAAASSVTHPLGAGRLQRMAAILRAAYPE